MDLTSKKVLKNLLKKYRVYPSKKLGQNFLIDKLALKKIIEAADLQPKDIVLEIGSGVGTLTQELAKRVKKVVAVEKDPKMIEILKKTLKDLKNVEVIQEDIIENQKSKIKKKNYKLVANLPYYIATAIIRKFLETENPPRLMVLMVQKEVAQRICAKPGTKGQARSQKMNLLAVSVQFYAKPEIISFVSKKSFWPQPKVDGAILRIAPLIDADKKLINADLFFRIVKAGFSHPRKQLVNNLSSELNLDKEKIKNWLLKTKVQPTQRAETLSIADWIKLTKSCKMKVQPQ